MSLADQGASKPLDDGAPSGQRPRTTTPAVVVGFDGSASSLDALYWACGEARRLGGRVVAVYVSSNPAMAGLAGAVGAPCTDYMVEQANNECAERLAAEAARCCGEGLAVQFVHAQGTPAHELLAVAKAVRADVLVVGRSTKARHHLAGSLGRALAGKREAPVVVIVP
ncbi:MAG: universal stress protein [Actinomycetota bacterium]|nr:universal stress protein [Actinomycetota bacterium]